MGPLPEEPETFCCSPEVVKSYQRMPTQLLHELLGCGNRGSPHKSQRTFQETSSRQPGALKETARSPRMKPSSTLNKCLRLKIELFDAKIRLHHTLMTESCKCIFVDFGSCEPSA